MRAVLRPKAAGVETASGEDDFGHPRASSFCKRNSTANLNSLVTDWRQGRLVRQGSSSDHLLSEAIGSETELIAGLIRRTADGDQAAFAEVFQRTSAKLFGLTLRILSVRGEAEDALQEVYLTIWRRAATFDRSRGAAWPWLIAITRNCAIDRLRASRSVIQAHLDEADALPDPMPLAHDMLLEREQEQRLAHCLDQLDGRDVNLIKTAFLEGVSYSELAQRLGSPLGTVKSRIRRALLRLRDCL